MTRSELMSRIRSKNTGPERRARMALVRAGARFRCQPDMPGRPDFLVGGTAVFVDGCFWHGCPRCYREPRTNRGFWSAKISRNKGRTREVGRELRRQGWGIVRLWEHEIGGRRWTSGLLASLA